MRRKEKIVNGMIKIRGGWRRVSSVIVHASSKLYSQLRRRRRRCFIKSIASLEFEEWTRVTDWTGCSGFGE